MKAGPNRSIRMSLFLGMTAASVACALSACGPSINIGETSLDRTPLVKVLLRNLVVGKRQAEGELTTFIIGEMGRTGCWETGSTCATEMGFEKCDPADEAGTFVCLTEFSLPIQHRDPSGSLVSEELMQVSIRAEFETATRNVEVTCIRAGTSMGLN